jgi:hypothetical protein
MRLAKIIRDKNGRLGNRVAGVGEISTAEIISRVGELLVASGRKPKEFTIADYERAQAELNGMPILAPDGNVGELVDGRDRLGEMPASIGHRVPKNRYEEEKTIAEVLVQEGMDEALHDEMVASGWEIIRKEGYEV